MRMPSWTSRIVLGCVMGVAGSRDGTCLQSGVVLASQLWEGKNYRIARNVIGGHGEARTRHLDVIVESSSFTESAVTQVCREIAARSGKRETIYANILSDQRQLSLEGDAPGEERTWNWERDRFAHAVYLRGGRNEVI